MNEDRLEILRADIKRGDNAETAYNLFIREHIDTVRAGISAQLISLNADDTEGFKKLKLAQKAIDGLEMSINEAFNARKLALKEIENNG